MDAKRLSQIAAVRLFVAVWKILCKSKQTKTSSSLILAIVIILSLFDGTFGFDYFQVVQLWQPSFKMVSPRKFKRGEEDFTLHGLWPDNFTTQLTSCPGPVFQNLKSQQDILWLDTKWKNLEASSPTAPNIQDLWYRQWGKHGTCSTMRQFLYLNLAVRLKDRYDLKRILAQANIWPRQPVELSDVSAAITGETKHLFDVKCRSVSGITHLYEIIICYDPSGSRVIDCPGSTSTSCTQNNHFPYYLAFPPI